MPSQNLENILAPLAEGFKQLEPDTFQTSAQLMNGRRDNPESRSKWFYTNNFAMYTVEDGKEFLYFGTENNPIFKNIDGACEQLINNHNYQVKEKDMDAVMASASSGNVLKIDMSELRLEGHNSEWKYVEINTEKYDNLNSPERALAEAVYGKSNDFIENMNMLAKEGIKTTRIYVLDRSYVRNHVKNKQAIARACWLDNFFNISIFVVNVRDVYNGNALRGVHRT
jgi:hypothetical protein